jgi:epsilon-lactone hydrolase
MTSPQAEGIMALMRAQRDQNRQNPPPPPSSIEDVRKFGDNLALLSTEPEGVTVEPVDAGGVPGIWLTPGDAAEGRAILYLHGGGYVIGSSESHRKLCGHYALATGLRILSVDYALAPERPHPAAVSDAVTAYRWLLGQGYEPSRLAISGDSAGGGLTVATLVKLRDEGGPLPAAAVPLSPWVDMTQSGSSYEANAEADLMLGRDALAGMVAMFLAGADPKDPLASPVFADLAGLPPLFVQVGGAECLLDDSRMLAERAEAAGVEVRLDVFADLQHVFQLWAGNAPEVDDAFGRIRDWLRPRLGL